ncbi:hypothetical protein ACF059_05500 [Streptomyces sp. NPDC016562]
MTAEITIAFAARGLLREHLSGSAVDADVEAGIAQLAARAAVYRTS